MMCMYVHWTFGSTVRTAQSVLKLWSFAFTQTKMWTSKTDPKTSDQNRFLTRKMAAEIIRNLSTLHILENWLLKTFTITLYNSALLCYHTAPNRFYCCQEADAIANCCCIICLRSVFVTIFFVYVRCYALEHQSTAVALPIYASYTYTYTYSIVFTLSLCLCYFKADDVF